MTHSDLPSFLEDAKTCRTIPVVQSYKIDTLTPIQIFNSLKQQAVYILESNDRESNWSNYSFIGLNAVMTIKEKQGHFVIQEKNGAVKYKSSSFSDVFRHLDQSLQIKLPDLPIPFKGGAVGFIGYDSVSLFEKVQKHSGLNDSDPVCSLAVCSTYIAFDHAENQLYFIQFSFLNGNEQEDEKIALYKKAEAKIQELVKELQNKEPLQELFLNYDQRSLVSFDHVHSNMEKHEFIQKVQKIKNYIAAGDVFQTVLSQRFEMPMEANGFELYRILRKVNPSPYLFYLKNDETEIVGSSPERLIHVQNGHLEIHPIAGTRKRGKDEKEDAQLAESLLADEKEKAEHLMLVDLARNDIGRVANYHSVKTENYMELTYFSHVMHLFSKVTGSLRKDVHPTDALLASFPAGTVSGAPKVRAMEILQELEPTPRNQYAGSIAYIGFDGNIDSCIAIRTAVVKNNKAYIQAGAGIVADSVPESEWEETRSKASALIKAIELANRQFGKEANDEIHTIQSR
ncbi:anthranilate synthase component I [Bacillus sp. FJAT-42376]|uniref:anthranilate synthase component I n=1 Tax=Bacillus sp. FJAT-42376 TaxID=2014076 RepID=UPI000F4F3A2E|nr:anthranilate synthase component I [Bacillus sp. FJAT-42376]AZB43333.1 anthranilate synthase component I [Bacillus sp. FJAT-42376]